MNNKLSEKATLYAFGEEKIKWSLSKCLEQIGYIKAFSCLLNLFLIKVNLLNFLLMSLKLNFSKLLIIINSFMVNFLIHSSQEK